MVAVLAYQDMSTAATAGPCHVLSAQVVPPGCPTLLVLPLEVVSGSVFHHGHTIFSASPHFWARWWEPLPPLLNVSTLTSFSLKEFYYLSLGHIKALINPSVQAKLIWCYYRVFLSKDSNLSILSPFSLWMHPSNPLFFMWNACTMGDPVAGREGVRPWGGNHHTLLSQPWSFAGALLWLLSYSGLRSKGCFCYGL